MAGKKKHFAGEQFRARGCYVSTVGKDQEKVNEEVRESPVAGKPRPKTLR